MKNLSEKDILNIVKDLKDTASSFRDIIFGVRDIIQLLKR